MRKIAVLTLCLALVLAVAGMAMAEDVALKGKITGVAEATDRNGNAYIRVIVEEERDMNGVKYTAGVPVMFFGSHVDTGKTLQAGDTINCIATVRWFQGRKSYTYLAPIVNPE